MVVLGVVVLRQKIMYSVLPTDGSDSDDGGGSCPPLIKNLINIRRVTLSMVN